MNPSSDASFDLTLCGGCALGALEGASPCRFPTRRMRAGTVVQGGPNLPVLHLRSGSVVLTFIRPDGQVGHAALRPAGALLGVAAVLDRGPPWEVVAVGPVEVCELPAAVVQRQAQDGQGARVLLAKSIAENTALLKECLRGRSPASVRLASLLVELQEVELAQVPRHMLAVVLGMRPETFSRAGADLRRRGLLARGPVLRVLDHEGLRRFALRGR